jgi:hypothetical protein
MRSHTKTTAKWGNGPAPKPTKQENIELRKDEIAHVVAPHIPDRASYNSWHDRHRQAHMRILAKYGNKMLK